MIKVKIEIKDWLEGNDNSDSDSNNDIKTAEMVEKEIREIINEAISSNQGGGGSNKENEYLYQTVFNKRRKVMEVKKIKVKDGKTEVKEYKKPDEVF